MTTDQPTPDHSSHVNWTDDAGNPTGGHATGLGYSIMWQCGPCPTPEARNGAFLSDVLLACRHRLAFFEHASSGRFACDENAAAITALDSALHHLEARQARRSKAGTQGTHTPERDAASATKPRAPKRSRSILRRKKD